MTFQLPAHTGTASGPTPLLTYTVPDDPLPTGEIGKLQITISSDAKDQISCNTIALEISLGFGPTDLFFGDPPTIACDSTDWQPEVSMRKRSPAAKGEDSSWCTAKLTHRRNGLVREAFTVTLQGQVGAPPGDAQLFVTENSKRGSEDFADKKGVITVTKDVARLYLRNVYATGTTDTGKPKTQFQENESIRLRWETNGTKTKVYLPGSEPVERTERDYTIKSGLKRVTTIVLCSKRDGDSAEVYASITLTVVKPEPVYLTNLHAVSPAYPSVPCGEFVQGQPILLQWQSNASKCSVFMGSYPKAIAVLSAQSSWEYQLPGGLEQSTLITIVATGEPEQKAYGCIQVPVRPVIKKWVEPVEVISEFRDDVTGFFDFYYKTINCADIDGNGRAEILGRNVSGLLAWGKPGNRSFPVLSDMSNDRGWTAKGQYETISCADINGDGKAEVIGRSKDGLHCWQYSSDKSTWKSFGQVLAGLSDDLGWNEPEHYRTIQCADINGDGKAELLARGGNGLICWTFDKAREGFVEMGILSALSDSAGWNQDKYYLTIQCADINGDGRAEILARGSEGLQCWAWQDSAFKEIAEFRAFPDVGGWDQEKYYATIQCADIDGDGKAELLARGAGGLEVWRLPEHSRIWAAGPTLAEMSDSNGWVQSRFYSTIQCADIDGDGRAEVFGLGPAGPVIFKLFQYPHEHWAEIRAPHEFFGDGLTWDAENKYRTIQFADIDGDGRAELIARDRSGIRSWKATLDSSTGYVPGSNDPIEFGVPYRIRSASSGKVLDDMGGRLGQNAAALMDDDSPHSVNRNWILVPNDMGFRIKSVGHGTVLDDWDGTVGKGSAALMLDNSANSLNRTWALIPNGKDYRIKSVGHETVLDDWKDPQDQQHCVSLTVDDSPNLPNRTWTLIRSELAQ